jgi:hypothetical protein
VQEQKVGLDVPVTEYVVADVIGARERRSAHPPVYSSIVACESSTRY